MATISRPGTLTALATAVASATGGLWLQWAGAGALPPGSLRYAALAVGAGVLGAFILWHRPGNRYGLTHLTIGVLFGTVVLAAAALARAGAPAGSPRWATEVALAWSWMGAAALLPLWVVAIATFPDGRFDRAVVKRATVGLAIVMPLVTVVAYLLAPPGGTPPLVQVGLPPGSSGPLAPAEGPHALYRLASLAVSVLGALAPLGAVVALVDRFRRAGPVLRQQIKWLLVGAAVSVALQAIPVQAIESEAVATVARVLVALAAPLPLAAAAMAIFKHGLWEIDVVISKGLVYALVSGMLTVLFLGIALVAGVSVGGRDPRVLAALALAVLVSFLAQPLRQRLERAVGRLLYGDEPHGLAALARLGDAVTPALDAGVLGSRIADAVRGGLRAPWAGVWLYVGGDGTGALRPLGVSGATAGPSTVLPSGVPAALTELSRGVPFAELPGGVADALRPLFPDEPAVVGSLTSTGDLLGLIACGGGPKAAFGIEESEFLAVVARGSALGLRNLRLEEELRQRLEQIERQAAELHDSRQRLVTAQDHERRRIERDLHDGAQQQLVALAARLRRATHTEGPGTERMLEELADEAEEAVFTLQELARGIYPSLLADRGLEQALRAHAARLPASVRVEVAPRMQGRRLEPQLEAAFYFVALEAMTNAVKHAPGARITVSLEADRSTRTVSLEVHDDGPGFDAEAAMSSSGLQNMADRIAALGGDLSVESAPGGGTWVRATVEERAEVRDLRRREVTPGGR